MPQIRFEYKRGHPVILGEYQITPVTKTLCIPMPWMPGGVIWNRPYAIEVQSASGNAWSLPVPDFTRQAQIALLAMGLIGVLLIGLVSTKK